MGQSHRVNWVQTGDLREIQGQGLDESDLCIQNLIQCLCRERMADEVFPAEDITPETDPVGLPFIPMRSMSQKAGVWLRIPLHLTEYETIAWVDKHRSLSGNYEYLGHAFFRARKDREWIRLDGFRFAELVRDELAQEYSVLRESDFLSQIEDSLRVMKQILNTGSISERITSFISSEQTVIYGHPFHPSPKSRVGFSEEEVVRYSPEFQPSFPLFYFDVRRETFFQESLLPETTEESLVFEGLRVPGSDFVRVPIHPWEAKYLLNREEIKNALLQDEMRAVGLGEIQFSPTASVRTLYSPEVSFFYKTSLHVRITNCIRRNTPSELKSALEVTRLLREIRLEYQEIFPGFSWLEEPAYFFVKPFTASDPSISEGFSLLLREGLTSKNSNSRVAASLFGNRDLGRSFLSQLIEESGLSRRHWFEEYIRMLVPPLLTLYFQKGVMFEPHLQNTLVQIDSGIPTGFIMRDFDNLRAISGGWAAKEIQTRLPGLSKDLIFTEKEGWNRFVYCLVVNHLSEAIYQISWQNPALEKNLWQVLRDQLLTFLQEAGDLRAQNEVYGLLREATLPAKGSLVTRFRRSTDREAPYFYIPNPFVQIEN